MSTDALHRNTRLGGEAADLLVDPAFALAVRDLSNSIVQQWASSAPLHREEREALYQQYTALTLVTQQLAQRAAAGRVAQERLKEDHELAVLEGDDYTTPRGLSPDWDDPYDWDLD